MSVAEILDALEAEVTEDGFLLVAKLREELKVDFWPEATFEAAKACFGPAVYARSSRTYKSLDRRIRHALRVWAEKCGGSLGPEQAAYADSVLAAAIRRGEREAGRDEGKRYSFVQANIARSVNHERVDAGLKARAAGLVDVTQELAESLA